ncbi:MAG: hypothetical protein JW741_11800 [Sedimentisphaerales bacterium]|nr:hypothetical protein [Sedimentisphaerales bacterium]
MAQRRAQHCDEPPVLLVKWYAVTKWLLERVDSFPKNQRFIFGQRIAVSPSSPCPYLRRFA